MLKTVVLPSSREGGSLFEDVPRAGSFSRRVGLIGGTAALPVLFLACPVEDCDSVRT